MIATAAVATLTSANGAFAQETAKGLLAIQVRSQGQVCDNPISATRDKKQSAPDVSVWVLHARTTRTEFGWHPTWPHAYSALNNRSE
jgi:hypothetical protein